MWMLYVKPTEHSCHAYSRQAPLCSQKRYKSSHEKSEYMGHAAESRQSLERKVGHPPPPCPAKAMPTVSNTCNCQFAYVPESPLLYYSLQKHKSDQIPGLPVCGLISPGLFWSECGHPSPTLLCFLETWQPKTHCINFTLSVMVFWIFEPQATFVAMEQLYLLSTVISREKYQFRCQCVAKVTLCSETSKLTVWWHSSNRSLVNPHQWLNDMVEDTMIFINLLVAVLILLCSLLFYFSFFYFKMILLSFIWKHIFRVFYILCNKCSFLGGGLGPHPEVFRSLPGSPLRNHS